MHKERTIPELRSGLIEKMNVAQAPQMGRSALRGDIALGRSEHFVSHHEFLHGSRTQQRRKIVRVEMPLRMLLSVGRLLVEAHRVRKRRGEQIVVTYRQAAQYASQVIAFRFRELGHATDMAAAQNHRLERPYSPVRDQGHEAFIFRDDAYAVVPLED